MEIKNVDLKFDDKGNIIPQQKNCSTCKKQMSCKLLKEKLNSEIKTEVNAISELELILAMYYICDDYVPMFIQYPITVNKIVSDISYDRYNTQNHVGKYVIISLNLKDYDENVHIGIYLGDLPFSIMSIYDPKHQEVRNNFVKNPAILVPKFNKIFYGEHCRWQFIETMDDINVLDKDEPKEYVEIAKNFVNH